MISCTNLALNFVLVPTRSRFFFNAIVAFVDNTLITYFFLTPSSSSSSSGTTVHLVLVHLLLSSQSSASYLKPTTQISITQTTQQPCRHQIGPLLTFTIARPTVSAMKLHRLPEEPIRTSPPLPIIILSPLPDCRTIKHNLSPYLV